MSLEILSHINLFCREEASRCGGQSHCVSHFRNAEAAMLEVALLRLQVAAMAYQQGVFRTGEAASSAIAALSIAEGVAMSHETSAVTASRGSFSNSNLNSKKQSLIACQTNDETMMTSLASRVRRSNLTTSFVGDSSVGSNDDDDSGNGETKGNNVNEVGVKNLVLIVNSSGVASDESLHFVSKDFYSLLHLNSPLPMTEDSVVFEADVSNTSDSETKEIVITSKTVPQKPKSILKKTLSVQSSEDYTSNVDESSQDASDCRKHVNFSVELERSYDNERKCNEGKSFRASKKATKKPKKRNKKAKKSTISTASVTVFSKCNVKTIKSENESQLTFVESKMTCIDLVV